MLLKTPSVRVEQDASIDDVPSDFSPADLLATVIGFIRRQFLVVLAVVPLAIGVAAAYLYTTPPLYSAQARILIDTGKIQVFKQSILGDDPVNLAMVDSLTEVLKSDTFALSIVNKLHLDLDPEFVGPAGFIGRTINWILNPFSRNKPKSASDLAKSALHVFESRLTIGRMGATYVIEITFQSTNPDRAAQIANTVAEAFILDQGDARYKAIGKATAWMRDRMDELRPEVLAAEHAVVEYKTQNNIVDSGGGHLIDEQQLSELNTALVKARADTVEARARLDRVSQIQNREDLDPAATELATIAETLRNAIIIKLRQQYLELAQREALLSNRLGPDHLAVINISNQMREIRRSIFDEFKRIAEAYQSEYDIAKARESSLEASLAASVAGSQMTNTAQIKLRQLESAAQSYHMLYDNYQQRYADSLQQQSFPITEARVISPAMPPSGSSSPKSFRILGIALIGGLGLGFGLAMLREISDRAFRTASQVEARLKTACIAMLPMIKPTTKAARVNNEPVASLAGARSIAQNAGSLRYVVDLPLSRFAEWVRAIKVSVDLSGEVRSNKVIGITSSLPNEGKSTVSASLAQLCALSGARVILVDCDLRKPSLSQDLAPTATVGLIDVVTDAASLDEAVWSDPSTKLSFLPVVVTSRLAHTSEILASAAMKRLFDRLRESYDYVIVDLSPLAPVVDVRAATHLLDCYLFVIEWGKTKIDIVEHTLNIARGVYDNLLGVVLNKVDFDRIGRFDHHRDQYYVNRDYHRYGYTD